MVKPKKAERMSLYVSRDLHTALKLRAATEQRAVGDLVEELLRAAMGRSANKKV